MALRLTAFALCLSLSLAPPGHSLPAPQVPNTDRSITAGEELVYEVSWWIVKLGTIRMRVVDTQNAGPDSNGRAGSRAQATVHADIDSYEELPFASLHYSSETRMDAERYSLSALALTRDGETWRSVAYAPSPERGRLLIERGTAADRKGSSVRVDSVDTLMVDGRFQDGLSIFYFARSNLFRGSETIVPTIVEGRPGRTVFRYPGERGSEEIGAAEYPIDVVGFEGVAEFNGIYGLTGDFEGWFTNDEARVPIRAKMGLMVGSVNIELIRWNRVGWNPPRAPED